MNQTIDIATLSESDLDALNETVHDAAAQEASNAINSGEQIDFLLARGWTLDDIRTAIA